MTSNARILLVAFINLIIFNETQSCKIFGRGRRSRAGHRRASMTSNDSNSDRKEIKCKFAFCLNFSIEYNHRKPGILINNIFQCHPQLGTLVTKKKKF